MAAQGRRSSWLVQLPGGCPQKVAVTVLRDALDPARRVRDPLEIHHRQQMRGHWVHDTIPVAPRRAQDQGRWRRELQDAKLRRAKELSPTHNPIDDLSPNSRPFGRQLQDARLRSKRLHTDVTDLEGPGKFHEVRSAVQYTRELVLDDPMCGFQSGDTAVLRPGGGATPRGDCQKDDDDFCVIAGNTGRAGFVEVIFHSDGQVAEVKVGRLAKIGRAEVMARKHRLKAAALGFGTLSDTGQGARRSSRRSMSLPGIPAGPRRAEAGPSRRGLAVGKALSV